MSRNRPSGEREAWGRNLKRLMDAKGMTQAELARAADNTPRNNISTYIKGVSYPTPLNHAKLAQALGVGLSEIAIPGRGHHDTQTTKSRLERVEQMVAELYVKAGCGMWG